MLIRQLMAPDEEFHFLLYNAPSLITMAFAGFRI